MTIICANCKHDKSVHFIEADVVYQNLCCVRNCKCNKWKPKQKEDKEN